MKPAAEQSTSVWMATASVLRRGLSKVAVYRDAQGIAHDLSAVCPHLGCIVHWNRAEKTWDCPCHGSRFDALGQVISGPANSPLAEVKQQQPQPVESGPSADR